MSIKLTYKVTFDVAFHLAEQVEKILRDFLEDDEQFDTAVRGMATESATGVKYYTYTLELRSLKLAMELREALEPLCYKPAAIKT